MKRLFLKWWCYNETELQVPFNSNSSIDLDTRLAGDNGKPAALLGGAAATTYGKIADGFIASGLVGLL